jgi:hypothetical protein
MAAMRMAKRAAARREILTRKDEKSDGAIEYHKKGKLASGLSNVRSAA